MEGGFPLRLKRKDLHGVSDDFSDFSLSSPARKIRRLDVELPPIIEEEECDIPIDFEHSVPNEPRFDGTSTGGIKIEELPSEPSNEERAIVLFKPINTSPLLQSPSYFSVDPHLISGFESQVPWSSRSNSWRITDDETADNNSSDSVNGCLAVVPWVPSQFSSAPGAEVPQIDNSEMMDAQEVEEATMDVEDSAGGNLNSLNEAGGMCSSEQFHQWQQQYCVVPQSPHNMTTPVVWYQ